jgi:hypothetical protein
VTSWPARTRCSAMGLPITPRPMNPIAVIGGPPQLRTCRTPDLAARSHGSGPARPRQLSRTSVAAGLSVMRET